MTKEEMADKWTKQNCCECCVNKDDCDAESIYCFAKEAYLAGAELSEKRIACLEKENAGLKAFINAPHTKGRKTTRADYIKTVWDLSKKLPKAKEIIKELYEGLDKLYLSGLSDKQIAFIERLQDKTEQFLKED